MPVAATGAGPASHDKLELKLALGQASSGRELRRFGRSSSRSSSSGRPKFSGMHAECPRCLLVQHWRAATADARSIGAAIKTFALRSPAGQQADAARAENDRPAAKVSSRALVRADYGSGLAVQDAINRSVRSSGRASVGCRAARADKTGVPLPRAAPARLKDPFSSKLLAAGHRQPAGKRGVCHDSRLASVGRWLHSLLLFQRSSRGGGARRSPAAHPQPRDTAATTSESESAAAAAPAPPEPMDITVRVEVQYHAPANAVTRDVLEMFRSTTWVRFMMRYISPRLKTSSPADQAILDELESQEAAEVHEGDECVICMSENPCDGHVALPCGHSFHYPCISSWLQTQSTCPVCRFQFPKAFTGKYAVQKLKSSMVLSEEQGKLPRAELLALDIGKQVVRAVVSVTLVKVAPSGDEDEFPCELSAFMLDPATGETFSELDCI